MSNPVPLCTHVKASGITCGSAAVKGTAHCYHHSATRTALGEAACPSIPFVFPEDRTSLQINYFLLLQAFNEGRIDLRAFNSMQRLLRAMDANLGKTPLSEEDPATADKAAETGPGIASTSPELLAKPNERLSPECKTNNAISSAAQSQARAGRAQPVYPLSSSIVRRTPANAVGSSSPSFRAASSRESIFTPEEIEARLAAFEPQYFARDAAFAATL